jgi:hypothetical protein
LCLAKFRNGTANVLLDQLYGLEPSLTCQDKGELVSVFQ